MLSRSPSHVQKQRHTTVLNLGGKNGQVQTQDARDNHYIPSPHARIRTCILCHAVESESELSAMSYCGTV